MPTLSPEEIRALALAIAPTVADILIDRLRAEGVIPQVSPSDGVSLRDQVRIKELVRRDMELYARGGTIQQKRSAARLAKKAKL